MCVYKACTCLFVGVGAIVFSLMLDICQQDEVRYKPTCDVFPNTITTP